MQLFNEGSRDADGVEFYFVDFRGQTGVISEEQAA